MMEFWFALGMAVALPLILCPRAKRRRAEKPVSHVEEAIRTMDSLDTL